MSYRFSSEDWQWISEYSQKNQHIFGKNFSFLDFREQYGRISLRVSPKICNTKWKINLSSWRFFSEFIVCVGPESVAGSPVVTSNMGTMSSPAQFLSWLLVAPDVQMFSTTTCLLFCRANLQWHILFRILLKHLKK